jgi:hypothetical protein
LALVPGAAAIVVALTAAWIVGRAQREATAGGVTAKGVRVIARYDIAGMLANDPLRLAPVLESHGLDAAAVTAEVEKGYSPETVSVLPEAYGSLVKPLGNAGLLALWKDMAMVSPSALLKHKWDVWMKLEGPRSGNKCLPVFVGVAQETRGVLARIGVPHQLPPGSWPSPSPYCARLNDYAQSAMFLFTGVWWLMLDVALIAVGAWRRDGLVCALCLAGTLHALSFLPISSACDFRFQYLTVVTAVTGLLLVLCGRVRVAGMPPGDAAAEPQTSHLVSALAVQRDALNAERAERTRSALGLGSTTA